MKKIYFIILLLPTIASAQFKRGNAFLGGTVSATSAKQSRSAYFDKATSNSISFSPSVGYFVNSRLAMGLNLQITRANKEQHGQSGFQSTGYAAGILGRYFFPLGEKIMFATTGNMTYGWSKSFTSNYGEPDVINKSTSMEVIVRPTILYFPTPHWGFEASLGFLNYTHYHDLIRVVDTDSFTANYESISLGVAYYFRKP